MSKKNLIKFLEENVNWSKFWGVATDLYEDPAFRSRASNITRTTIIEKSLSMFSSLIHVDQIGYDFVYPDSDEKFLINFNGNVNGEPIELKMGQNICYSPTGKNVGKTKAIKMKNYQGSKKTLEDFKAQSTFSKLIVVDLKFKKVLVAEDELVRGKYFDDGDGVFVKLEPGDYHDCNIGEVNPVRSPQQPITYTIDCETGNLGEALDKLYTQWILNR